MWGKQWLYLGVAQTSFERKFQNHNSDFSHTLECVIGVPPLINFLFFFCTQGILIPTPSPVNYCGKFPTQTDFLKQYTYADFCAISQKVRPMCSVLCFVNSCKEANTLCFVLQVSIKKPTYCQLLTSFRSSNRMLADIFIELVARSYWWTLCVLSIIRILYCRSLVPLVSFWPYCFILFLLNINA